MIDPDTLSVQDLLRIKTQISDPTFQLQRLQQKVDYLEELRCKGAIPNSYVAFEVIAEIVGGCENGFEDDVLNDAVSQTFGEHRIKIPSALLIALMRCWHHYKTAPVLDLDTSFGMNATGNSRKPKTKKDTFDDYYYYAEKVLLARLSGRLQQKHQSYEDIYNSVAEQERVSPKTIQTAWKTHKRRILNALSEAL